jgi:5-deoxy-glucuronate isomerase
MFIKNSPQHDELERLFDLDGFCLYSLKTRNLPTQTLPLTDKERLVFSLKGQIRCNDQNLLPKDMMYVTSGEKVELSFDGETVAFIAETGAAHKHASYVKRYKDAQRMKIGQPTFRRSVVVMIGEKDPANKFIAGYVEDSLGEWSSYPPHKHDGKPEAYVFYGINPGFAIQAVLDGEDEAAYVVHDYDTVLFERGYHPHVNTSLTGSNYAWIISAPADSRTLAVDIHPAFKNVNLGQSHLSINKN